MLLDLIATSGADLSKAFFVAGGVHASIAPVETMHIFSVLMGVLLKR